MLAMTELPLCVTGVAAQLEADAKVQRLHLDARDLQREVWSGVAAQINSCCSCSSPVVTWLSMRKYSTILLLRIGCAATASVIAGDHRAAEAAGDPRLGRPRGGAPGRHPHRKAPLAGPGAGNRVHQQARKVRQLSEQAMSCLPLVRLATVMQSDSCTECQLPHSCQMRQLPCRDRHRRS